MNGKDAELFSMMMMMWSLSGLYSSTPVKCLRSRKRFRRCYYASVPTPVREFIQTILMVKLYRVNDPKTNRAYMLDFNRVSARTDRISEFYAKCQTAFGTARCW